MSQLSEEAAVRRLGDRLGFGLAGNALREARQRGLSSLTDLDDGDLKAGTDFRSIYAALLDHVLGADPERILEAYSQQVDKLIA
jgi:hypothetical protein